MSKLLPRKMNDFLCIWERMNNPNFNVTEFCNIKNEIGRAESPLINSVGQRPTKRSHITNLEPQRGVINLIINH